MGWAGARREKPTSEKGQMSKTPNDTTGKQSAAETATESEAAASTRAEAVRMLQLMWAPPAPPSRGPKPKISLDQVVDTAVRIADEQGQEALSMRRVATELQV